MTIHSLKNRTRQTLLVSLILLGVAACTKPTLPGFFAVAPDEIETVEVAGSTIDVGLSNLTSENCDESGDESGADCLHVATLTLTVNNTETIGPFEVSYDGATGESNGYLTQALYVSMGGITKSEEGEVTGAVIAISENAALALARWQNAEMSDYTIKEEISTGDWLGALGYFALKGQCKVISVVGGSAVGTSEIDCGRTGVLVDFASNPVDFAQVLLSLKAMQEGEAQPGSLAAGLGVSGAAYAEFDAVLGYPSLVTGKGLRYPDETAGPVLLEYREIVVE